VRCWPSTNSFLSFGVLTSVPILVKIDQEMRPWECSQTDRYADTLTDWQTQSDFIICPMLYATAIGQTITNFNSLRASVLVLRLILRTVKPLDYKSYSALYFMTELHDVRWPWPLTSLLTSKWHVFLQLSCWHARLDGMHVGLQTDTAAQIGWFGLRVGGHPALSLHSSNEPSVLSQWLCNDDSTINIVSNITLLY